ncbi:MAG: ABC transporter substrate-binding protein [Planctomycetes bacterium]|nr:ABC transporter substrate-binding protein [Planctomycetota bacterium]
MRQLTALRLTALALAALLLAPLLTRAQPVPPPPPAPAPVPAVPAEGTTTVLRLPVYLGETTLDPHAARDAESFRLLACIYEGLYSQEPGSPLNIQPRLAEALPEVSEDGLTWTIRLRKDVKFHNSAWFPEKTRTLRARDVLDSLKRLAAVGPEASMYWLMQGAVVGLDAYGEAARDSLDFGANDKEVAGLKAVDEHTVQIKLTRPFGALLSVLAHPCTSIMPRELMNGVGLGCSRLTVGTGPYRLHAIAEDSLWVLKRFAGYCGELPHYERVVFFMASDQETAFSNFAQKQAMEVSLNVNSTDLMQKKPGSLFAATPCTAEWVPRVGNRFAVFNMQSAIWGALDADGRGLRRAVSLAFDRAKLIATIQYAPGWAAPSDTLLPPGCEAADLEQNQGWGQTDANAAKLALDGTKYKGGVDPATGKALVLKLELSASQINRAFAQTLSSALKPLGITVDAQYVTGAQAARPSGDLRMVGWYLDFPDAQNVLQLWAGRNAGVEAEFGNHAGYRSADYDKLYAEFESLLPVAAGEARRRELVAALLQRLEEDRPFLALAQESLPRMRSTLVQWPQVPAATYNDVRHIKAQE